ncbi:hypothetical protein OJ998_06665 [Solirubrobacter taibaiensis]|nr:hypothetical protein [Solirubrobacter taibaiensis]
MNSNPTGGRLAAIITGGVLASVALLVLVAGAGAAWLDSRKDADGYYMTDSERFSTTTHALASENLDINDDIPGAVSGTLRLDVQAGAGKPVFAGIARSRDVKRYLATSPHATLTDIDVDPFAADYRTSGGTARPGAPAAQDIWVAKTQGTDPQRLTWHVDDGDWSVVVMNADGSANVEADVAAGTDLPIVGTIATILLVVGGAGALTGTALIAGGFLVGPSRSMRAASAA